MALDIASTRPAYVTPEIGDVGHVSCVRTPASTRPAYVTPEIDAAGVDLSRAASLQRGRRT